MGAALKVLTQYGFKKDHIVSTIKELIEVLLSIPIITFWFVLWPFISFLIEKDFFFLFLILLLQEYGGEDGWVFIEDNGYQVVVDSILDKQSCEQQKVT